MLVLFSQLPFTEQLKSIHQNLKKCWSRDIGPPPYFNANALLSPSKLIKYVALYTQHP